MEKEIGSKKTMGIAVNNTQEESQQKFNYKELNNVCAELSQQNKQMEQYIRSLHKRLNEMSEALQLQRLDYLFKVVEFKDSFDTDFVTQCVKEIQESFVIPEEVQKKDTAESTSEG